MNALKLLAVVRFTIGCGAPVWAEEGHVTKTAATALVKPAVAYIKAVGPDKAYAEIDTKGGQFHDRDLYIFVQGLTARCSLTDPRRS